MIKLRSGRNWVQKQVTVSMGSPIYCARRIPYQLYYGFHKSSATAIAKKLNIVSTDTQEYWCHFTSQLLSISRKCVESDHEGFWCEWITKHIKQDLFPRTSNFRNILVTKANWFTVNTVENSLPKQPWNNAHINLLLFFLTGGMIFPAFS